jgi:hypothetical protein
MHDIFGALIAIWNKQRFRSASYIAHVEESRQSHPAAASDIG